MERLLLAWKIMVREGWQGEKQSFEKTIKAVWVPFSQKVSILPKKEACQAPRLFPGKNATPTFPSKNKGSLLFLTPRRPFFYVILVLPSACFTEPRRVLSIIATASSRWGSWTPKHSLMGTHKKLAKPIISSLVGNLLLRHMGRVSSWQKQQLEHRMSWKRKDRYYRKFRNRKGKMWWLARYVT